MLNLPWWGALTYCSSGFIFWIFPFFRQNEKNVLEQKAIERVQSDSTLAMVLALYIMDPGSIPEISDGPWITSRSHL